MDERKDEQVNSEERKSSSTLPLFHSSIPALLFACLLLAGCTATHPAARRTAVPTDSAETQFVRRIDPFPVYAADGARYAMPFLGGLKVPRPQLVDIDGDGDLDLFLQEETNQVMFFENVGTPTDYAFVWRTDKYRDLDVGEWYRFYDLDTDGDFDLLAEQPYNRIRYYRNVGAPTEPEFVLAVDTLRDVEGDPIFSDRQNIPNVVDIDCNGRPDLFLGRLDGTITRYQTETDEPDATPRFALVTEEFEDIQIIGALSVPGRPAPAMPAPNIPQRQDGSPDGGFPGGNRPSMHGANTMVFTDVDDDGDVDLIWGDFFEPGLLLIENVGSCEAPNLRVEPEPFPPPDPLATSGYNAATVGDLNGDGLAGLLVGVIGGAFNPSTTARANLYFYEKESTGTYRLRTRRFLDGIDVGSEAVPAFGDIDGGGDLDMLVGNKISTGEADRGYLVRFRNEGSAAAPAFRFADSLDVTPSYNLAPALGDLNGDGAPDLVVGTWNDGIFFYRNDPGSSPGQAGAFVPTGRPPLELSRGSHSTPALGDIDGDGDLDLFVGETSGAINFYRNTGTPEAPQFELVSDEYAGIDAGRRSAPALVDLDGDGLLDLLVGTEAKGILVFYNTGTPEQPAFPSAPDTVLGLPATPPPLAAPALVGLDDDGERELFIGTGRGGIEFYAPQR